MMNSSSAGKQTSFFPCSVPEFLLEISNSIIHTHSLAFYFWSCSHKHRNMYRISHHKHLFPCMTTELDFWEGFLRSFQYVTAQASKNNDTVPHNTRSQKKQPQNLHRPRRDLNWTDSYEKSMCYNIREKFKMRIRECGCQMFRNVRHSVVFVLCVCGVWKREVEILSKNCNTWCMF